MDVHKIYGLIFRFTRKRRMERHEKIMRLTETTKIIDLGGTPHNWRYLKIRPPVVLVNILPQGEVEDSNGQFTFEVGDACSLGHADRTFDLAFSNSVIEHVGDYERQRKFAREVCRVGEKVWVQTPARSFFIEPHYLTIFVHWLPKSWQKRILPFASVRGLMALMGNKSGEKIDDMVDEIRLLTKAEMKELFPDCEILTESFLLCPKSYIAVRN